jgi:hypothetical protein
MPKPQEPSSSQGDIDAFAAKLAKWSEGLPDAQRSLAQLLVEQARDLTPSSLALSRITADLRASARAVIDTLNLNVAAPQGWVRIDPIWERKNKVELGEDVEILQRVFVNMKR